MFVFVDEENYIWEYASCINSTLGGYGKKKKHDKFIYSELDRLVKMEAERNYNMDYIKVVTTG